MKMETLLVRADSLLDIETGAGVGVVTGQPAAIANRVRHFAPQSPQLTRSCTPDTTPYCTIKEQKASGMHLHDFNNALLSLHIRFKSCTRLTRMSSTDTTWTCSMHPMNTICRRGELWYASLSFKYIVSRIRKKGVFVTWGVVSERKGRYLCRVESPNISGIRIGCAARD